MKNPDLSESILFGEGISSVFCIAIVLLCARGAMSVPRASMGLIVGAASVYTYYELKRIPDMIISGQEAEHSQHISLQDAKEKNLKSKIILKYGIPVSGPKAHYYKNHVLGYDQSKRIPTWVAEYLTKENLKGSASRSKSKFKPDPDINPLFTATNRDYLESEWSRGHMAPAGDNKREQAAMDETFLLSNIVPQDIDNNKGYWNQFETYCRDLTNRQTREVERNISCTLLLVRQMKLLCPPICTK